MKLRENLNYGDRTDLLKGVQSDWVFKFKPGGRGAGEKRQDFSNEGPPAIAGRFISSERNWVVLIEHKNKFTRNFWAKAKHFIYS